MASESPGAAPVRAPDPLYRLDGVRVVRGGRPILDVASLEIARGEFVAVHGPNGAGKTTLLRVLALLLPPDEGALAFDGSVLAAGASAPLDLRRRVTLVAQDPYFFSGTVLGNAAWGLAARGVPRARAEERAAEALALLGLSGFERRKARTLSAGEGRRLAVARAAALGLPVLLIDEPTANADEESRGRIEDALRRASRDQGTTVVMATHDADRTLRLAARRLALRAGRIADALRDNVFRGEVSAEGGRVRLRTAGGVEIVLAAGDPGPAEAALDPSAVILSLDAPRTSAQNVLRGTVTELVEEGERVRVTVDAGVRIGALLTHAGAAGLGLAKGKEVFAVFKANSVRLL